jgi:hypothetical protein
MASNHSNIYGSLWFYGYAPLPAGGFHSQRKLYSYDSAEAAFVANIFSVISNGRGLQVYEQVV